LLQAIPKFVVHGMRVSRFAFCQFEGGLFSFCEIRSRSEICKVLNLIFGPAVPPCQGGV
jgi:hypothetical protein